MVGRGGRERKREMEKEIEEKEDKRKEKRKKMGKVAGGEREIVREKSDTERGGGMGREKKLSFENRIKI